MPCLYTDENCSYFYAPRVTKKGIGQRSHRTSQALSISKPEKAHALETVWSLHTPLPTVSACRTITWFAQRRYSCFPPPWVLATKSPASKTH